MLADIRLREVNLVTDMCVIGGKTFFILSESLGSTCKFETKVQQTGLRYQIDLKSTFMITTANVRCLGDRVAIIGRASTAIKFILIDPKADLTVQNRIRALLEISAAGVLEIKTSTSKNRVILTVVRSSSPKFEFFSIYKNGIRRFYFKGSSEQLSNRSNFAVQVASSIPENSNSYSFNMNLSRKAYTKGATTSNITYIGTLALSRTQLGEE